MASVVYMVNHGSLFCSKIIYFCIDLSQFKSFMSFMSFTSFTFLFSILQALYEVVGQPTGFFCSRVNDTPGLARLVFCHLGRF